MVFSKHVTLYGQLWSFLYYNLTTPLPAAPGDPYPPSVDIQVRWQTQNTLAMQLSAILMQHVENTKLQLFTKQLDKHMYYSLIWN